MLSKRILELICTNLGESPKSDQLRCTRNAAGYTTAEGPRPLNYCAFGFISHTNHKNQNKINCPNLLGATIKLQLRTSRIHERNN